LCSQSFHLSLSPDIGFAVPDAFVVGYAIDYNEHFRDLDVSPFCLFVCLFVCFLVFTSSRFSFFLFLFLAHLHSE